MSLSLSLDNYKESQIKRQTVLRLMHNRITILRFLIKILNIKKFGFCKYCFNDTTQVQSSLYGVHIEPKNKLKIYNMGCYFSNNMVDTADCTKNFRTIIYYDYCFADKNKLKPPFNIKKEIVNISSYIISSEKYQTIPLNNTYQTKTINSLYLSKNLIKFHSIL